MSHSESKYLQIVGFPRSGNTYLARWSEFSELNLKASHHHFDYNRQAKLLSDGVITYVIIREPAASIASCMVWNSKHGFDLQMEVNNPGNHFNKWRQMHNHVFN